MAAVFRRRHIRAKTLGQRLKACRLRKKFTLEEVEEATKIRLRYLEAIEADNHRHLPSPVYLSGYLTRYANFLDLSSREILAQYRAESGGTRHESHKKYFRLAKEMEELRITITPKTFLVAIIVLLVVGVLGYIGWQVKKFSDPPRLEITAPTADVVNAEEVIVEGTTSPTAKVAINGQDVAVDEQGAFSQKVGLAHGVNNIEVKATNRLEKETVRVLKIFADYAIEANPPI